MVMHEEKYCKHTNLSDFEKMVAKTIRKKEKEVLR